VIIQADNYAISFLRGTRSKGSFTDRYIERERERERERNKLASHQMTRPCVWCAAELA